MIEETVEYVRTTEDGFFSRTGSITNSPKRRAGRLKRVTLLLVLILLVLGRWELALSYSGGAGTSADPYQIASGVDLLELMNAPGDWGAHFILTNNIDAIGIGSPTPIGNPAQKFTGVLDGQQHVISNLTINLPLADNVGLFGYIGEGAIVRNLGLENGSVSGHRYVGMLCGWHAGTVSNCHVTGNVWGDTMVGGFCGGAGGYPPQKAMIYDSHAAVTVVGQGSQVGGFCGNFAGPDAGGLSNCYATGNVMGQNEVGGLCGHSEGDHDNCYATGDVTAETDWAGGLIGYILMGNVNNSYATGNVTAGQRGAGGFCGVTWGNILDCYATGNATAGQSMAGGFSAYSYLGVFYRCYSTGDAVSNGTIAGGFCGTSYVSLIGDCFSTGMAYARDDIAGGFCGNIDHPAGFFHNCFSTGAAISPGGTVGGFCGSQNNSTGGYIGIFWDIQTSGCWVGFGDGFSDPEVQGLATAPMKMRATFEDAGWDFVTIWDIKEGLTYPFLRSLPNPFPEEPPVEPVKHAIEATVPTLNSAGVSAFVFLTMIAMTWLRKRKRRLER